jgi:hypothetical protein
LEISVTRGLSVSHDAAVLALLLAEWGSTAQRRWRGYKVVVPTGCSKPTAVAPEAACQNVARYHCLSTSCQVRPAAVRHCAGPKCPAASHRACTPHRRARAPRGRGPAGQTAVGCAQCDCGPHASPVGLRGSCASGSPPGIRPSGLFIVFPISN